MNTAFEKSKKVANFMQARTKNIVIVGVLVAASFGVVSAGLLLLNPKKAQDVTQNLLDNITAKASLHNSYSLPPSSHPDSSTPVSADVSFLKSFSKVFAQIAKETRPSLVLIVAEKKVAVNNNQLNFPDDFFFPFLPPQFGAPNGQGRKRPQGMETDAGSGFIVDLKNGYVITNNHVIENADKITITTFSDRKFNAKVVGTAKNVDIAVLKLLDFTPSNELKQVSLGDSGKVEVGDWAVALGAPFELPQTLTMGVVSAIQRPSDSLGILSPNSFIQTDASINPGNSGGPLVNIEGQVIGMNTAIYSKNGTSVGIGFAIPSNTIRLAADSIINRGKFVQSYLGVEMYNLDKFGTTALKDLKVDPNAQGGLVMKIVPNSPAEKAGLKPYDIIQSVNGTHTNSPSDIQRQITFLKPSTKVTLGVLRNGQPMQFSVTVEELPNQATEKSENLNKDENGDQKVLLSAKYGIKLSTQKSPRGTGVVISDIRQGSVAEMANLRPGDIILKANNKKISSPEELEKILATVQKDKSSQLVFLLVEREGVESGLILQING